MAEISTACLSDQCDDCNDGTCRDFCHQSQAHDSVYGWIEQEEDYRYADA